MVAAATALIAGQGAIGSAQAASTVTVAPATPTGTGIGSPFGYGSPTVGNWGPYMAFVYRNLPAFSLRPGDTIAFDLSQQNDVDIQLRIKMAPTTINGGDVNAAPPTQIVPNTQVPTNPRGNTIAGDYELTFTVQAAFDFAGGGLVISLGNPGGLFASDVNGPGSDVQENNATGTGDASGFFVERLLRDTDGSAPWDDPTSLGNVAGFRLNIADVPPTPPATAQVTPTPAPLLLTPKKKCKKKHKRAASAKKCKKKRR